MGAHGTACTYLSYDGLVVSVAIISTEAFDLERHDPQSVTVPSDSASAYAVRTGPLGEARLFPSACRALFSSMSRGMQGRAKKGLIWRNNSRARHSIVSTLHWRRR